MTKYLDKSFKSPANSREYVDNWERVFGVADVTTPTPKVKLEELLDKSKQSGSL